MIKSSSLRMIERVELNQSHAIVAAIALVLAVIIVRCLRKSSSSVYLVDFSCYRPPDHLRVPISKFNEHYERTEFVDRENIDFQMKVNERSGVGDEACFPPATHELPPEQSFNRTREEVEMIIFPIIEDLFSKNCVDPKQIDILITNCSIYCPVPSICTTIIHHFGLRPDVKSFNLAGMGCSAGIIAIGLASDLLRCHAHNNNHSTALVLSMEATTLSGYTGRRKSMILTNALFRMGGAAILLSNTKLNSKYKLKHIVRTHVGSDDDGYASVFQDMDDDGRVGVRLSRSLVRVAGLALAANLYKLGPLVLPWSEQLRFAVHWIILNFVKRGRSNRDELRQVPDFKKAFQHFCVHAGGKTVIDAAQYALRLDEYDMEASRMTFYRFGNTSSSSVWYELCYLEAKRRVKRGDQVWQLGFGSGFKCNSAVWECISEINHHYNAWSDRIHLYPLQLPSST